MYRLQRMFNECGFLCHKLRSIKSLKYWSYVLRKPILARLSIWKPCLVKWFLTEVILKVCIWLKFFNDLCNFLLKASTSLLTYKKAHKSNQCGAHIAITLILLLLNAKSKNKDVKLSHFSLYFKFNHIQELFFFSFFLVVFDHHIDCGNGSFPMGIRLRETSYIINVVQLMWKLLRASFSMADTYIKSLALI